MVDMGKKIKEATPHLWELLGVLLDANLTHRCAAPKLKKTYVKEDVEMDLGEIGTEGAQQEERAENWADLDASDSEASSSEDEDELSEVFSGQWNQLNPEGKPNTSSTCLWTSLSLSGIVCGSPAIVRKRNGYQVE